MFGVLTKVSDCVILSFKMSSFNVEEVLGPVTPTMLRVCGFLPLDLSGFPVFSEFWFCYSIFVYFLFSMFSISSFCNVQLTQNVVHIVVRHLFVSTSFIVNWAASKSGTLCKTMQHFFEFDRKVRIPSNCKKEVLILLIVAIICFVLSGSSDIYHLVKHGDLVLLCFPVYSAITLVSQSLVWILVCLFKQKMRILNLCLAQYACLTEQPITLEDKEATDKHLSLTFKTLTELSAITMQNLSLIKSSFGVQIAASYGVFYDQTVFDSVFLQMFAIILEIDYYHFVPWSLSVFIRFIFLTWITASTCNEMELFSKGLTRTMRSSMSADVRRQIKTLKLRIYHQCSEPLATSFSVYKAGNFLPSIHYMLFNFIIVCANSIVLRRQTTHH